jgi:signal peptidase II
LKKSIFIILLVLIADQALKLWIKTNMELRDSIEIFSWFKIYFTENPGMAFGLEYGGNWGKLALSIFRLFAIGGLIYWLNGLIKKKSSTAAIISVSLITAGAVGNMIDSAFYGLIFDKGMLFNEDIMAWTGYNGLATYSSAGYSAFLRGNVVDMLYFPLYEGFLPDWIPFKGGDYFIFFRPIFNIADMAISTGVGLMILFQKRIFPSKG